MIKKIEKGSSYHGLVVLGLVICFLAFLVVIYYGTQKGSFGKIKTVETTTTVTTIRHTEESTLTTTVPSKLEAKISIDTPDVSRNIYCDESGFPRIMFFMKNLGPGAIGGLTFLVNDKEKKPANPCDYSNSGDITDCNLLGDYGFNSIKIIGPSNTIVKEIVCPQRDMSKKISISDVYCLNKKISFKVNNIGYTKLEVSDTMIYVNDIWVGGVGNEIEPGSSYSTSVVGNVHTGNNILQVVSPTNLVTINVWCLI